MVGGLIGLIRYGCQEDIKKFKSFEFSNDPNLTILIAIVVIKQGYNKYFYKEHIDFIINEFDKIFLNNHDVNTICNKNGNTYLHLLCESTPWDHPFCKELFDYFIKKGIDPSIKNFDGKTCVDLIAEENKYKVNI